MNLAAFLTAVKTRLEADTGTGGLFKSGAQLVTACYSMVAPPDLSAYYPYLLIDHAGDSVVDGFDLNAIKRRFRVHTYVPVSSGYATVDAILVRIYGDGGRTPSYGLHRHSLTIASGGWAATAIEYQDTQFNNDEEYYQVVQIFETLMSKASS